MTDDSLKELLLAADEQLQASYPACASGAAGAGFVASVRRRHAARRGRRKALGALAVFLLVGGVAALSLRSRFLPMSGENDSAIAAAATDSQTGDIRADGDTGPPQGRRLGEQEIMRLRADIAALEAEAVRAQRLAELYQATEARWKRVEQAGTESPFALLSREALAEFEIDRAAATTIVFADAQATLFHRPAEAAEAYRSTLEHFPASRWAAVAEKRLAKIESMN